MTRGEFVLTGGEDYTRVNLNAPPGPAFGITGKVDNTQTHSILLTSPDYPASQYVIMLSRADGTFRFENILPGKYDLLATSMTGPGAPALHGRTQVDLDGQSAENVLIPVRPALTVEIVLNDVQCTSEATLTLTPLERLLGGSAVIVSATPGKPIRVDGLAPTQYEIATATREGRCLGTPITTIDLTRAVPATPIAVTLYPSGSIQGKVAGAPGQAIASVSLRDMEPSRESAVQVLFVVAGGAFKFEHLAPGRYCVTAEAVGGRGDCASAAFDLAPGESKTMNITIAGN